ACRSRPCLSGRGRCNVLVTAGVAIRCARDTTRWDCRVAERWGRPLPPPRTPSRCRGPAAAAFGTEMLQRSCSFLLMLGLRYLQCIPLRCPTAGRFDVQPPRSAQLQDLGLYTSDYGLGAPIECSHPCDQPCIAVSLG